MDTLNLAGAEFMLFCSGNKCIRKAEGTLTYTQETVDGTRETVDLPVCELHGKAIAEDPVNGWNVGLDKPEQT
jgi:hypothetical protein